MKRSLRVAIFTYANPATAGGVQECTAQVARGLSLRGHEVVVFGPVGRRVLYYPNYRPCCHSVTVPSLQGNWTDITVPFFTQPRVSLAINGGRFNLLHIQTPFVPLVSFELLRRVTVPIVATFQSGWESGSFGLLEGLVGPMLSDLTKTIRGVTYVSSHVRRCWERLFPSSVDQRVIYNGADSLYYKLPLSQGIAKRLLFVGRLVPRKGLRYLIEAMSLLKGKFPKIVLDIVGDGPEWRSMKRLAVKFGLTNNVVFHGERFGKEKLSYYKTESVFCAPYTNEGFPLSLVEGMAAGLPIVGFRSLAIAEALEGYPEPQLLVAPGDVRLLAKALDFLLEQPRMVQGLRQWVRQRSRQYSWDNVISKIEEFYQDTIKDAVWESTRVYFSQKPRISDRL